MDIIQVLLKLSCMLPVKYFKCVIEIMWVEFYGEGNVMDDAFLDIFYNEECDGHSRWTINLSVYLSIKIGTGTASEPNRSMVSSIRRVLRSDKDRSSIK